MGRRSNFIYILKVKSREFIDKSNMKSEKKERENSKITPILSELSNWKNCVLT